MMIVLSLQPQSLRFLSICGEGAEMGGETYGYAQDLLLTLCVRISPGGAWGTITTARD